MEWVSYLAGEPHGDQPVCVSPVVRAFCIALNDALDDTTRQRLRPYLARTLGTADDGLDEQRAWSGMDWLIRVYTPAWLSLAGLEDVAQRLRALAAVRGSDGLAGALEPLDLARRDARAAWTAALGAVRMVAGLPWLAGRTAAREAAWGAGAAAAWAAARAGVGDIAGDRARAWARAAGGDAAAAAARSGRGAGTRVTAVDGAQAVLAPTAAALRESAFALLDRMLPTVIAELPVVERHDAPQLVAAAV